MKPSRHLVSSFCRLPITKASGLTLVELLVALVIAGTLIAAAGSLMLSHMLNVRQIERGQRNREDANRFNYFLSVEASESSSIAYGVALSGCSPDTGTSQIALTVPKRVGQYADTANNSTIYYYNSEGDLKRCGPPVTRNGVLSDWSLSNAVGVVSRRTTIAVIDSSGSCGVASDQRTVFYSLDFAESGDGRYAQCQIARAKTVFVCNPPVGSGGAVGDC
jgi:prepilin-type N-terminal cleavage/methylation domain-containing protein